MLLFRREFLLTSFDRDLPFFLKGRQIMWNVLLYLLGGLSIAFGVIMAGPLLLFGFLVLPALAARPLVHDIVPSYALSSFLGLFMAMFGFYSSVRLGPAFGADRRDSRVRADFSLPTRSTLRRERRSAADCFLCVVSACVSASCGQTTATAPLSSVQGLSESNSSGLAKVKNTTDSALRLPATNPLRSLAEMAGKISSDYRQSVMDLLRDDSAS